MTDWCIHIANLFYLASFLGRDMLWLRALTCLGLVFGIVFFTTCQPVPMYGPTFWHVTFLAINCYQIRHLILQRRRLCLAPEVERSAEELLADLSDQELADSLSHAVGTPARRLELVTRDGAVKLTSDEEAFRDIAFSRLSRQELTNLLTRRMWRTLKSARPRWRRGPAGSAKRSSAAESPL